MKYTTAVLVSIFVSAHAATAEIDVSGSPAELRAHLESLPGQVTISGHAERAVEADKAIVQLSVVTSERLLKPALEKNTNVRSSIVAELAEGGISEARIHTSRFASTPVHSSWSGKVKQYRIKSTVRIHAETEKEVQLIAGLVDTIEEVSLASMSFDMTRREEVTVELLAEAFGRIQERRKLYESSLGVLLRPKHVAVPGGQKPDRRTRWLLNGDDGAMSASGILSNPELSVVLHALEQRAPEVSQFEELLYKVGLIVTFDILPQNDAIPSERREM